MTFSSLPTLSLLEPTSRASTVRLPKKKVYLSHRTEAEQERERSVRSYRDSSQEKQARDEERERNERSKRSEVEGKVKTTEVVMAEESGKDGKYVRRRRVGTCWRREKGGEWDSGREEMRAGESYYVCERG